MNRPDKWRLIGPMDYRELAPGDALAGLVKAFWSLDAAGAESAWIEHEAVPDGCIELIRRLAGRSCWGEAQPPSFAVGLIERPERFRVSGDARFAAVRIWPWAWHLISELPLAALSGRWIPFEPPRDLEARLAGAPALAATGRAVVAARSVEEMARATGMGPRALQRWFERHVGVPPRRYLRLLRFQRAFAQVPGRRSLAEHAAEHGFADQAHMAREFRSLAGAPPRRARDTARGPFLR